MNRPALLAVIVFTVALVGRGQLPNQPPREQPPRDPQELLERQQLVAELQSLSARSAGFNSALARARAKAEVASALWLLDQKEAKRLLSEAYELTLPEEEERNKTRALNVGADYPFTNATERARREVRIRVLQVAGRDRDFAKQLSQLATDNLGKNEEHLVNSTLAREALGEGNTEAAGKYLTAALEAEPTQTQAGLLLQELAKKDRAAADAIIVKYIERLRAVPHTRGVALARIYFVLVQLVFPNSGPPQPGQTQKVLPPGPAVMRAYAGYVVQGFSQLRQADPSALTGLRNILLSAAQPVRQYAPELLPTFLELERLSRNGNDTGPIPTMEEIADTSWRNQDARLNASLNQGTADPAVIDAAVRRGLYDKARRAIENLPEGDTKLQLTDYVNAQEAVSLAGKGDVAGAARLAEKVRTSAQIVEAYLALIEKCGKDQTCKIPLIYRTLTQIRDDNNAPQLAPPTIPSFLAPTKREVDPKLAALGRLAAAAVSADDNSMRATLNDLVLALNRTSIDADLGKLGFDIGLFKKIAQRDEGYAGQTALAISDPLRRLAALSAVDEWKAGELKKKEGEPRANVKKVQTP